MQPPPGREIARIQRCTAPARRPGMAAATRPLVSTPRPVAAQASSIQPRGALPASALRCAARKAHERHASCRRSGSCPASAAAPGPRTAACRRASPRPANRRRAAPQAPRGERDGEDRAQRRRARYTGAPRIRSCPNSSRLSAVAQYCSGGFSMYTRPFRCGIDPVAARQHLARNLRVAALVGIEQRPQRQRREPEHGEQRRQAAGRSSARAGRQPRPAHVQLGRRRSGAWTASEPERPAISPMTTRAGGQRPLHRLRVDRGHVDDAMRRPRATSSSSDSKAVAQQHALELGMQREHLRDRLRRRAASADRRNTASAMFDSSTPSRPRSSSKVGSVVGICGQVLGAGREPRQERRRRRAYRSRTRSRIRCSSSSAWALICQPAAACDAAGTPNTRSNAAMPRSNSVRVQAHRRAATWSCQRT